MEDTGKKGKELRVLDPKTSQNISILLGKGYQTLTSFLRCKFNSPPCPYLVPCQLANGHGIQLIYFHADTVNGTQREGR